MKKLLFCAALAAGLVILPIDSTPLVGGMESLAIAATTPRPSIIRGEIESGTPLGSALGSVISPREVHDLVETARSNYDLAEVKPGQPYRVSLTEDGHLRSFSYAIDELRTLRVLRRGDEWRSEISSRSYDVKVETAAGVIDSSLFEAIDEIGEKGELAMELSEIFGWDIDFNTSIQRGDQFRVVVEKFYLEGDLRRYGKVLAAEFVNAGRTLMAVRFDGSDGKPAYYAPSGEPLRKAFLKSPLRFTRVSSRFTRSRYHPVLHFARAHNGTDLAASYGTPVRSIGQGQVVSAGYQGGYGNLVVVRHANGYTSYYGHLSRINVRGRQHVSQGDLVGLVGATGLATGPHLHFGMMRNGIWTDPMRVQGPPADPLNPADIPAFEATTAKLLKLLPPRPTTLAAANDLAVW